MGGIRTTLSLRWARPSSTCWPCCSPTSTERTQPGSARTSCPLSGSSAPGHPPRRHQRAGHQHRGHHLGFAAVGLLAGDGRLPEVVIAAVLIVLIHLVLRPAARRIDRAPATEDSEVETRLPVPLHLARRPISEPWSWTRTWGASTRAGVCWLAWAERPAYRGVGVDADLDSHVPLR